MAKIDQSASTLHLRKLPSRLAWAFCGMVFVISLFDLGLQLKSLPGTPIFIQWINVVAWATFPMVFAVVAALIISRQPQNLIGWLLMTPAFFFVIITPVNAYLGRFATAPQPAVATLLIVWFQNWSWLLLIFPLLLILLLFPTGNPPSPRWRWALMYALGLFAFFVVITTFVQDLQGPNNAWSLPNPIGFIPNTPAITRFVILPWIVCLALLVIVCAASLFWRYRRAQAVERIQIKWLLFAGGMFVVFYVPLLIWQGNSQGGLSNLVDLFLVLSTTLFPISIAIAILRYRLWDIDVIIRKTLTYSVLTASLALTFFFSVVLLQQVVGRIVRTQDSPIVIVLSTMAIAALFNPLRRLIQDMIDRRFYRKNYDARKILERFIRTTRYEVEAEQLGAHLISVVEETLQPESVSLWLVEGKKGG